LWAAFRHRDCHHPAVSRLLDFRFLADDHRLGFHCPADDRLRVFPDWACLGYTADDLRLEDSVGDRRLVVCRHWEAGLHLEADDNLAACRQRGGPADDNKEDVRTTDNQGDTGDSSRRASKDCRNRRCGCK
jgi:hypothetical protein